MAEHKNRLVKESSPYLKQHADNPVDWFPWGKEALDKAKSENKLIFISIGYSACHWCHVMERESFSKPEIAALLNDNYIAIKIDREERPDLDQTYMSAVQLMTGGGGWPLSCFTTPEGKPFYGGTYYTPDQFSEILLQLNTIWKEEKDKILEHAEGLCEGIRNSELVKEKNINEGLGDPDELFRNLAAEFDAHYGGLSRVPKFPMPSVFQFLFHYHHYSGNKISLSQALKTTDAILQGGIYDQIGGGIARYSTDKFWQVPHFEKMLYDNAQFIGLLSTAYMHTGDKQYSEKIYQSIEFLERELYNGDGGYYSSIDADSEGEEGKFYVWTKKEIASACGENRDIAFSYYGITEEGNWENGKNILSIEKSLAELAEEFDEDFDDLQKKINTIQRDLLKHRNKRIRPGLDSKVLTAWNALMAKALADAFQATGDYSLKEKALRTGSYILEDLSDENHEIFRSSEKKIKGFMDDYAFSCEAFVSLYQISFDESWLKILNKLIKHTLDNFYDKETAMFFYSSAGEENPVTRQHEFTDNVIPASNSVMAKVLLYASVYFDNPDYQKISRQMLLNVQPYISRSPSFFTNWLSLLVSFQSDFSEIVIAGKDILNRREEFCSKYLPDVLFAGAADKSDLSLLKGRLGLSGTKIYVCRNRSCKAPVDTVKEALDQLQEKSF
ncbi:MAG: thioredoxin domain-containing protein [Bacteroidota bacterium]